MCRSSLDGNREIPRLASCGAPLWPASGRRGAVADDERTWEVRLRNSSWEADEQSRATGRGVGGAKCGGRGECDPAKHAPGAGPGKCVTGAGAHTASRKATEEGTVHLALPPYQRRTPACGILCPQARCRTGCGWADMAGLRGKPRSQDRGVACAGPSGSISGSAVSATLHTKGRWSAAPARNCRTRRQNRPEGGMRGAERDLRGRFPWVLVWVPTEAQPARCYGCTHHRNPLHKGELYF